jgi:CHASE2 domain-containing sensor protein
MVDFGFNAASLLGIIDIILSFGYSISCIVFLITKRQAIDGLRIILYVIQTLITSSVLIIVGMILFFNGWRLDPILQFAFFLLNILVVYLAVKDIFVLNRLLKHNRRSR